MQTETHFQHLKELFSLPVLHHYLQSPHDDAAVQGRAGCLCRAQRGKAVGRTDAGDEGRGSQGANQSASTAPRKLHYNIEEQSLQSCVRVCVVSWKGVWMLLGSMLLLLIVFWLYVTATYGVVVYYVTWFKAQSDVGRVNVKYDTFLVCLLPFQSGVCFFLFFLTFFPVTNIH